MTRIAVVYHSVEGSTEALARAVAAGSVDVDGAGSPLVIGLGESDIAHGRLANQELIPALEDMQAIVFGSPTFMGGPTAQFKAFADATSEIWERQAWRDRVAAGFTIGSNFSGDQLATLQYFHVLAMQHGMICAGLDIPGGHDDAGRNRLGAQGGLVAHSADGKVDPSDLDTARYLGRRVTDLARRLAS